MSNKVFKFFQISGLCNKKNDLLLYSKKELSKLNKLAVFFHGDLQNYEDEMIKYSCTKDYVEWSLDKTIQLVGDKFPDYINLCIKCTDMCMNRFSRYRNFIDYDNDLLVKYRKDFDALQHLEQLILNLKREIEYNPEYQEIDNFKVDNLDEIIIIGFSKGCAVVNQIMIGLNELRIDLENSIKRRQQINSSNDLLNGDPLSLSNSFSANNGYLSCSLNNSTSFGSRRSLSNSLSTSFTDNKMFFEILNDAVNKRLDLFFKKLKKIILLDLGCNVVDDEVYILDDQVLQNIKDLNIEIQIHCTPYQVYCTQRPHIGRQEKEFAEKFKDYENFKRKLYFENRRSIDYHFRLLKEFNP